MGTYYIPFHSTKATVFPEKNKFKKIEIPVLPEVMSNVLLNLTVKVTVLNVSITEKKET